MPISMHTISLEGAGSSVARSTIAHVGFQGLM